MFDERKEPRHWILALGRARAGLPRQEGQEARGPGAFSSTPELNWICKQRLGARAAIRLQRKPIPELPEPGQGVRAHPYAPIQSRQQQPSDSIVRETAVQKTLAFGSRVPAKVRNRS